MLSAKVWPACARKVERTNGYMFIILYFSVWSNGMAGNKALTCEISFIYNIRFSCPIVLKFGTEHGNGTVVLCAKCQTIWSLSSKFWPNKISRELSLRYVSGGYPTLHKAPGVKCIIPEHSWTRMMFCQNLRLLITGDINPDIGARKLKIQVIS